MIKYCFLLLMFIWSLYVDAQSIKNNPHINSLLKESKCKPYKSIYQYDSLISREAVFLTTIDSITENRFSEQSIRIATSIGIIDLLKEFSLLESLSSKDSNKVDLPLLFLRQELDERLTLNFMDVTTVIAELDCEQERWSELRNYIQDKNNRKIRTSSMLAIVVGAIETVGGGLLAYYNPDARGLALGISATGGFTGGYLGFRQLFIKENIEVSHKRNHLRELRDNPAESKIFPPNIWFFLTAASGIGQDTLVKSKELLKEFKRSGFLEGFIKVNGEKHMIADVLFSDRGIYNASLLSKRISMLELLKIQINMMKYDLKRLQQELVLKTSKN